MNHVKLKNYFSHLIVINVIDINIGVIFNNRCIALV